MIWARIKGWLAALGAVLAAIAMAYFSGRRDAGKDAEAGRLQDYQDTRRRIDNADVSRGGADDDARWLRDRARR